MTDYPPVDIATLVRHAVDSGSDYDDGLGGYCGGSFDAESGFLTLAFKRDEDIEDETQDEDFGYVHGSAEYRFQLIPAETPPTAPKPLTPEEFGGTDTPHGRILNTEDGTWIAYGHLSKVVFMESFNWVIADLDPTLLLLKDISEFEITQAYAVIDQASGAHSDEWQIRYPDSITRETPGAFAVTVLKTEEASP